MTNSNLLPNELSLFLQILKPSFSVLLNQTQSHPLSDIDMRTNICTFRLALVLSLVIKIFLSHDSQLFQEGIRISEHKIHSLRVQITGSYGPEFPELHLVFQ